MSRTLAIPQTSASIADTSCVLGTAVHALTQHAVLGLCQQAVERRDHLNIGVVNAAKLVNMYRDEDLRQAVLAADLVLADGQSVVWASRMLGKPLPERVTGIDLFVALLDLAEQCGYRTFFLGATREVLDAAVERIGQLHPRLQICGHRDGYFPLTASAAVADEIAATRPDLLFVGMTSPRKEVFLNDWSQRAEACVSLGVGGSFDVLAGLVHRAPLSWQRLGLEWLYRVKQEPRRLWKRYLVTNTAFLALLGRDLLARRAVRLRRAVPVRVTGSSPREGRPIRLASEHEEVLTGAAE
jgi:N-acetylglucosaminyldiphosphoundecaprenol N-acetyl-beta-D-mannosaminyltransferase